MRKSIVFSILIALSYSSLALAAETYTFSVVPQQSASKLARLWTPILTYLSEKLGIELQFTTAKNIPVFEQRLSQGEYSFAYMNPYHYTVFSKKPGYVALAKQKNKKIKGIMVVQKSSAVDNLADLAGGTLAFPSPAAFAASLLTRAQLASDNIAFVPKYVSSHDSVYLGVSKGLFPAGGGIMRTFNNTDSAVRENLRVLWTTKGYTPHAIAAHPDVSPDTVKKLQQALLEMNTDPEGIALLKTINFKGIETATSIDWDDVRQLGISALE